MSNQPPWLSYILERLAWSGIWTKSARQTQILKINKVTRIHTHTHLLTLVHESLFVLLTQGRFCLLILKDWFLPPGYVTAKMDLQIFGRKYCCLNSLALMLPGAARACGGGGDRVQEPIISRRVRNLMEKNPTSVCVFRWGSREWAVIWF